MDPLFLVMCLIPVVAGAVQLILKPSTYSWREAAAQAVLCTLLVVVVWNTGRYSAARDVELWNGTVSSVDAVRKDCPWGWVRYTDSHCTHYSTRQVEDGRDCDTVDGKQVCTTRYRTEYRYDFDWERRFYVRAEDIGLRFEVARVDRQGVRTPPAFSAVSVGDPAAKTSSYDNWVRAAASSLYHQDGRVEERYADMIPDYSIRLYDTINVDRVLAVGVDVDAKAWSRDLSRSLSTLGPQRQMNAVLVLVDGDASGRDYAHAVRRAWQGFKKNDAIVFAGVGPDLSVRWVEVLSWSKTSAFDIGLRDALETLDEPLTSAAFNRALVEHGLASYERRSMTEFEYLKESIPVPGWLYVIVALLSVGGTAGLSYVFHRTEF